MNSPPSALPDRLVFGYTEAELTAYSHLVWARRDRGPSYENFKALMIVITFAIGFVVLFANYLGFVTSSQMPPVLFTAYAAFVAGAFAHRAAIKLRYRSIARAMYRDDGMASEMFEMTFDASGVVSKNARFEMRLPWAAIAEVIEAPLLVVLLFEVSQGLPIPVRLFSDPAARADFIAMIRAHASGAQNRSQSRI